MAGAEERFLSDVHVLTPFSRTSVVDVATTRFKISRSTNSDEANLTKEMKKTLEDEDGDLVPLRKNVIDEDCDIITIEHHLSTVIKDVGLQVWRGTLLLCDYIIHNEDRFEGCTFLELGAGLGLCSIVVGRVAKKVFCTDIGDSVLQKCQVNVTMNSHLFKHGNDAVIVRELDWLKSEMPVGVGDFCWTKKDQDAVKEATVILAADVIYDDFLTDGLIQTILKFFDEAKTGVVLILAIEKRLNFTLRELTVTAPAYDHFLRRIEELETVGLKLKARQLSKDFPKYLQYERVKELELWEIKPS
ncbi:methyltransferase-like protein 22 isoform X1 [Acropora millepora]|uniref:methyltransferase-like protein 22 isoform X1 n=2 Tax=Acropora millepora TaxID=45264 RepID=UPI001CF1D6CC|nr:methyltransferase-like protein 22 isoform X1 [Acropora millepora]